MTPSRNWNNFPRALARDDDRFVLCQYDRTRKNQRTGRVQTSGRNHVLRFGKSDSESDGTRDGDLDLFEGPFQFAASFKPGKKDVPVSAHPPQRNRKSNDSDLPKFPCFEEITLP